MFGSRSVLRLRSKMTRAMSAMTAAAEAPSAILKGCCTVHSIRTVVGAVVGSIHQPLAFPSTSCGVPRSPVGVLADHAVLKPSPRTTQHPAGHGGTSMVLKRRPVSVTTGICGSIVEGEAGCAAGSTKATWSTLNPVLAPAVVVKRWCPASKSIESSQGCALNGAPSSASAVSTRNDSAMGSPSNSAKPTWHCAASVRLGPISSESPSNVSSLMAAGRTTGSPNRRSRTIASSMAMISTLNAARSKSRGRSTGSGPEGTSMSMMPAESLSRSRVMGEKLPGG